ncbi:MAG: hypothetical protein DCC67_08080 [Planctomycetota bacterium]|nr:MAG: hypothetical protein DCC67_08080 [Planctomycetota bacterium]
MFEHSLAFDRPGYLALLVLVPVVWRLGYRSLAGLGRWRRWLALSLRTLVVVLLVLALADVQYQRRSEGLTVVYLLDQSLSVPAQQRAAMIDYVRNSIRQHRRDAAGDRFAVIVFGRDAEVEVPPVSVNEALHSRVESQLDPEYTDLATAIQRAKAIFPYDAAKRIVLVTDGNQNVGNAYREARGAAESGVSIDVVPVHLEPTGEIAVEKLDLPSGVRRGQPFDMRIVLRNDAKAGDETPVKGRLVVVRKAGQREETIAEESVAVAPGKQVLTIQQEINQPDFYTYEARFVADDPAADGMAQNNSASAFTHIRGSGQVLLIENIERPGEFDYLVERLRNEDIEVTPLGSDRLFNSLAELQRYDAVVLANVARSSAADGDNVASFSDEQIEMLVRNTRELGCGLIMLGGPDTFGAGGWANTKLEEAMPVDFQIKSAEVVPVGALCLMMHAGEIPQSNYWQKRIAIESIKVLGARDYCGLVQWNGGDQWLWGQSQGGMIRVGPSRQMMLARIDRMTIGDMPAFDGGMKMAATGFARLDDASVKHMIIISDGDPAPPSRGTMSAFVQQGVKITTVAVGSHGTLGSQTMRDIAVQTGGKYYEVRNSNALPKIYQREARRVAMPLVYEPPDPMAPIVEAPQHEILRGTEAGVPPITGYVLTTVKQNPLVEVILRAPEPAGKPENTTLLAAWTYGAGKAVAMTTDAGARWTKDWPSWDGYDKVFSQMVRWAMRPTGDTGNFTVAADVRDGRTEVVITAMDDEDQFLNDLAMTATAVTPDLKSLPISIQQTAPGRYVGSFPSEAAGSYLVVVTPGGGKAPIRTGVSVGYSPEYRDNETNEALLKSLAQLPAGGGPAGDYVEQGLAAIALAQTIEQNPFRRDLPPAVTNRPIWPWLVALGSCLFWGDVFVRRVQVSFTWLLVALRRARDYLLGREPVAAAPETMSRLRSRKREVTQQLEGRRAAARFEATGPTAEAGPPPLAVAAPPEAAQRPAAAAEGEGEVAEGESYTERLLKVKKQVRRDRDENA